MASKILVIDDDRDILELEKSRLEAHHYDVITATDGVEGMVKARQEKPDLIVMDVVMPHLDGYTFLKDIKLDPEMNGIPIVVLTTRDKIKDLFEIEGIKSENYLIKPFNGEELVNRVDKILHK